jgi:hypothetical protein
MLLLRQLVAPQAMPSTETVYYTTPAAATGQAAITAKITRALFVNTTGSAVTLTAGITTGAALTGATTLISMTIPANQSYVSAELAGAVIPAGSVLRASTGTNNALNIMVSGLTIE